MHLLGTHKSRLNFAWRVTSVSTDSVFVVAFFKGREHSSISTVRNAFWQQINHVKLLESFSADAFFEDIIKNEMKLLNAGNTNLCAIGLLSDWSASRNFCAKAWVHFVSGKTLTASVVRANQIRTAAAKTLSRVASLAIIYKIQAWLADWSFSQGIDRKEVTFLAT